MHCLQSTFTKVEKVNPQLDSNVDHGGTVWQFYHDILIDWMYAETIDIYESPIDNIIFNEPSSPDF